MRVFGTTIGHHNETMSQETYLDLVTRGLLWACRKLDKNGKPVPGYAKPPTKQSSRAARQ
jgi:type 1 glutamine amidotransferase